MGRVIELGEWRARREARTGVRSPVGRLEAAVARLDSLIGARIASGREITRATESELLAVAGALSAGLLDEAATRLERLADRMEHPAASGH
jgi:predicted component of type VI protein secretion system